MKGKALALKDTELKLVSELMKNSRRSDRELAKAIGTSQPTVSRMIARLEKQGIIKEYTMIPDFAKLGYGLMTAMFVKVKGTESEDLERAVETTTEEIRKNIFPDLLNERGLGLGYNGVIITLHRDYSDYAKQLNYAKSRTFIQADHVEGFVIDLKDPIHFRSLTLSLIANDLMNRSKEEETQS